MFLSAVCYLLHLSFDWSSIDWLLLLHLLSLAYFFQTSLAIASPATLNCPLFPSPRCFGQFSHSMTRFGNSVQYSQPANQRAAAPAGTINRACISFLNQNTFVDHSNRSLAVRLRKIWECTKVGHTVHTHKHKEIGPSDKLFTAHQGNLLDFRCESVVTCFTTVPWMLFRILGCFCKNLSFLQIGVGIV